MSDDRKDKRKERVLHTRVSEKLDEELREKAAGLGVSVSNLVRNILLNTVEMVEDIVADSSSVVRSVGKDSPNRDSHHRGGASASAGQDPILGWQILQLNLNAVCSECNAILAKNSTAAIAVSAGPIKAIFRCQSCVPGQATDSPSPSDAGPTNAGPSNAGPSNPNDSE